jgi:2',3'-cyclic-nucleotide 2'-phosphodiesterase
MTGPYEGIIGVDRELILEKFLKHIPVKFEVAKGSMQFNAVVIEIDEKTGKTMKIERISQVISM